MVNRYEVLEEVYNEWRDCEYGDHFEDWLNDELSAEYRNVDNTSDTDPYDETRARLDDLYEFVEAFKGDEATKWLVHKAALEIAGLLKLNANP